MNQKNSFINLNKFILIIHLIFVQTAFSEEKVMIPRGDFSAYYTHITTKETLEKTSRTGDYADIIVNLNSNGISSKNLTKPSRPLLNEVQKGRTVIFRSPLTPVAWFRFDEASGDSTRKSISNILTRIKGSRVWWRQGISGTSLQFDDVSASLTVPAVSATKPQVAISLEGWVAIGAYPWNWRPIVQQTDDVPELILNKEKAGAGSLNTSNIKGDLRYHEKGYFL